MADSGADIQVENGNWAKVHNTILKKLAVIKLDGSEAKCLFFLFSMTYGKREKDHAISLSLWADGTDIEKRNVARVIDKLVQRNIIYRLGSGRGRGAIAVYGFNKHFEQWDKPAEKVCQDTPIEKVSHDTPLIEEKVYQDTPEKVYQDTPTIERSSNGSLLAAESDDAKALMILAYQTVCKIGPPMREPKGRAALITASELIERFGYKACLRGIATLKERYYTTLDSRKQGISAPLPYLRSIMEDELSVSTAVPTKVDFAYEDIAQ